MVEKAEPFYIDKLKDVKVIETGNIVRIKIQKNNAKCGIKKIDANSFIHLETGEYKEFNHKAKTRFDNIQSVRKSFRVLRDIINTNITDTKKCLFVTLTYAENMQDEKRLYNDFRKFNMRFKDYCKKNNYPKYEYICVAEPQGRGAWHCHVIYIFESKTIYINNDNIAKLWGFGFTKTKGIKSDVDNLGVYLTSYICDIEISEIPDVRLLDNEKYLDIKEVEVADNDGNKTTKRYVKGLRMAMYPAFFKLFRTSRGIKRPKVIECKKYEADEMVKSAAKTYESTISIKDKDGIEINKITNIYYNKKRKK